MLLTCFIFTYIMIMILSYLFHVKIEGRLDNYYHSRPLDVCVNCHQYHAKRCHQYHAKSNCKWPANLQG